MRRPQGPLFVARRSYRQRRMRDAARLLPFLGVFLFALLLQWEPPAGEGRPLAWDAVYVFAAWAVLILLAAILSRRLSTDAGADEPAGSAEDE